MDSNFKKFIKFITSRLFILMIGFFVMFMILGIHLFKLQIIEGELHKSQVNTNVLKELPISAPRGTIYDRYGKPLAVNKIAMSIKLDPSIEVENQDEVLLNLIELLEKNNEKLIDELPLSDDKPFEFTGGENEELSWKAEIFGVSTENLTEEEINMDGNDFFEELRKFFNIDKNLSDEKARKLISLKYSLYQKRYKKYQPITVAYDIQDKTIAELEENYDKYPGFYIDIEPVRYYPEGELVSHILGYTGKITQEQYEVLKDEGYSLDDIVGRIGIEKEMESYLRGEDGVTFVEVDPLGQRKEVHSVEDPTPGGKVFLTLDLGLQEKVSNILENKLKDIILSRIEKSPSKNEPPIYLEDMLAGLVSTNTVYIEDILEAPLGTAQNSIAKILEDRLEDVNDEDKAALAKQTLIDMIKNKEISFKDFINVMIEQGVITVDDSLKNNLEKGIISPLEIIKNKIQEGEISPHNLGLDPSTGAVVVVDVHSGEVLSLVSYPSYDNNKFINGIDYKYYKKLQDDPTLPMFPRATNGRMAPGSTFKMITGMAVLEEGIITPTEKINATGLFKDAGVPYARCWIYSSYHIGHGLTDISRALEVSCNYFFYDVSYRMAQTNNGEIGIEENGLNILKEYASKFGLDSKTGIEIGEYAPKLSDTDVIRSAIGQGTHNFAPIHMARYVATLANGGTLYDLHIIDSVKSFDGELLLKKEPIIKEISNFDPENLETIYKGMNLVTEGDEGTVRGVFKDFPIKVAGKTGTAQEQSNRGEHAWFVGFAPYEDPQIAIAVVIPYGYSSSYPAEIFRDIVAEYFGINEENEKISMDNILY
ncbi:penicillin-binding transpeptidase domain-containing protein [Defluviitalea phaphyphila]|uniref:penicillin-binding transpeptidase domain-containing protein n=1 Tax=Defluviitalea phaphyphila TaxID=1473580 RepID=UPI00072FE81E|nr:penicillin-binding transpeptidase domain-containing protein [Defluviitalea phaphyphila]